MYKWNVITRSSHINFQIHDELERDNDDIEGSGSGFGPDGDDEDDIHTPSKDKESRLKQDQTTNLGSSGDGSDVIVDSEITDDDGIEKVFGNRAPSSTDGEDIYFTEETPTNSNAIVTSTDNKIASTTTDDEDSQFNLFFIFLYLSLLFWFWFWRRIRLVLYLKISFKIEFTKPFEIH